MGQMPRNLSRNIKGNRFLATTLITVQAITWVATGSKELDEI
jgi:hypothetical protein